MPRFVIDLGDIDMSPEMEMDLNRDLQRTALGYVAGLKFDKPFAVRFPIEWLGIILRRDFDHLFKAERNVADTIGDVRVGRG
jgi:hypothetical protein